ncbi:alpha/beta fold hydrolase [Bacillus sp. Marseille-P3661]|uniref:alpha/beta fold hydrolase n=1 Tax=Bacillus sp. Marseille-P3661 TaxID=1936234 RepID=UPI0015E1A79A|nr:alpha/beta hydrolase [Bacillus sp. Marseille-P3661]
MLHGAEYGGNSLNCWEYNIDALSKHFHVFAVDMVGFGETEKLFSFDDVASLRINHIKNFMDTLCIPEAHFIGNSFGGGLILKIASDENPAWNIKKIISISGGGPNNKDTFHLLNNYDCSKQYMKRIHEVLFFNEQWKTDEYVEKRYQSSIKPGAWEALSVARFRSPIAPKNAGFVLKDYPPYENIKNTVLVCCGDKDDLKLPDYKDRLAEMIPNCQVKVFENCKHNAQIEYADEFNRLAIEFLLDEDIYGGVLNESSNRNQEC